jgi:hypothetical protein
VEEIGRPERVAAMTRPAAEIIAIRSTGGVRLEEERMPSPNVRAMAAVKRKGPRKLNIEAITIARNGWRARVAATVAMEFAAPFSPFTKLNRRANRIPRIRGILIDDAWRYRSAHGRHCCTARALLPDSHKYP